MLLKRITSFSFVGTKVRKIFETCKKACDFFYITWLNECIYIGIEKRDTTYNMTRYNKSYINEDRTYKNMKRARDKYLKPKGYSDDDCKEASDFLKRTIPNVKNMECHFIEGVTRMYADGELDDSNVRENIDQVLGYLTTTDAWNEFGNTPDGRNLNGMTAMQLIDAFKDKVEAAGNADKENLSKQDFGGNNGYDIVLIDSFEKASEYAKYTSWCVTESERAYNNYTKGGTFYFCLKSGFENVERVAGANAPLDEYGLSMIAVSIYPDGKCNTITSRWNHEQGADDHVMTTEDLSKVIGENFYDVFKPVKRTLTLGGKEYIVGMTKDGDSALYDEQGNNVLGVDAEDFHVNKKLNEILGYDALVVKVSFGLNCLKFQDGKVEYLFDEWVEGWSYDSVLSKQLGVVCLLIKKSKKWNYAILYEGKAQYLFDKWFNVCNYNLDLSQKLSAPCFDIRKSFSRNYAILRDGKVDYLFDEWFEECWDYYDLSEQLDAPCLLILRRQKYNFAILYDGKAHYLFDEWFDECEDDGELSQELGTTCIKTEKSGKYNYTTFKDKTQQYLFDKWFDECKYDDVFSEQLGVPCFKVVSGDGANIAIYQDGEMEYMFNKWVKQDELDDAVWEYFINSEQQNEDRVQHISRLITEMVMKKLR